MMILNRILYSLVILLLLLNVTLSLNKNCNSNRNGLPENINDNDIIISNTKVDALPYPNKVYYHGLPNNDNNNVCISGYLYVIGGKNTMYQYLAKLDSVTLEIYQKITLPTSLSIGSLLLHNTNGHIYYSYNNKIIIFYDGDLNNSKTFKISNSNDNKYNNDMIQSSTIQMTTNGHLIVRYYYYYYYYYYCIITIIITIIIIIIIIVIVITITSGTMISPSII